MKYRFGFILSTALGNQTRYENFKKFADLDPEIEIVWAPVKHYFSPGETNPFRLLPRILMKRAIVFHQSWPVLRCVGSFDAVMVHMYEVDIVLALRSYLFATPIRVISTDDAPVLDPTNYPIHPVDRGKPKWRQDIRLKIDLWRARKADFLIPFSHWAADILTKGANVPADRVLPVHVGLNLDLWRYQPRAPDQAGRRCRLLFVGGDFGRKGGADLLAVFRAHLTDSCELHLVTKQPPSDLPDHVHVHTDFEANDQRLSALYRSSDIFVLPTYADLSSWVLLEAMASGCATISTPVGGIVDIVRHGKSGWLVAPGDLDGLASAIKSLVDDPALRVRMGATGRQLVEQNFDASINVPRILRSMKDLIDARPSGSSGAEA
ncbi:MAG: glycosyltransferase family 4 protein [Pseudomonadota bacterium]